MGNSAWGHGYHQGFDDGAKKGAIGATIVVSLVAAAAFGYREIKARSFAKHKQELSAQDLNFDAGEGAGDEHEAGEGITSE